MYTYETLAPTGREAERVTTAFYRFVELNSRNAAGAALSGEVLGNLERLTIHLWSAEAVAAFERFLAAFTVAPPAGLPQPRSFRTPHPAV